MKKIVFNSFPRSGNVYQGFVCGYFFNTMSASVHIPEIFSVKELNNVTVFRKPEDAISSLIIKNSQPESDLDKKDISVRCEMHIKEYREYIEYAKLNKDIIYIGKFDSLITDTVKHFENIANHFNIPLESNYKSNFDSITLSGKLWDDRYDGHKPRPKDLIRLNLEEIVKSLSSIKEINQEYQDFIDQYSTFAK